MMKQMPPISEVASAPEVAMLKDRMDMIIDHLK
jgi:hypothetical protein